MRVLLHHLTPFSLAHDGSQTQILRTRQALVEAGVEAEFLRWYDGNQTGEVLHFFGRIPAGLLELAHEKAMKVVLTDWLAGDSTPWQRWSRSAASRIMPQALAPYFGWDIYRKADACVAFRPEDASAMIHLYGAAPAKTHVLPPPTEPAWTASPSGSPGNLEFGEKLKAIYESVLRSVPPSTSR